MQNAKPFKASLLIAAIYHFRRGAVVAVFVELIAKSLGAWSYSKRMAVFFGVGILPILQLALLAQASVWICRRFIGEVRYS